MGDNLDISTLHRLPDPIPPIYTPSSMMLVETPLSQQEIESVTSAISLAELKEAANALISLDSSKNNDGTGLDFVTGKDCNEGRLSVDVDSFVVQQRDTIVEATLLFLKKGGHQNNDSVALEFIEIDLKHTVKILDSMSTEQKEEQQTILIERLRENSFRSRSNKPKNLFKTISDQLYGTPKLHQSIRVLVLDELKKNSTYYSALVDDRVEEWSSKISKHKFGGDLLCAQVIADVLGVNIFFVLSLPKAHRLNVYPKTQKSEKVLWLGVVSNTEYFSLESQPLFNKGATCTIC